MKKEEGAFDTVEWHMLTYFAGIAHIIIMENFGGGFNLANWRIQIRQYDVTSHARDARLKIASSSRGCFAKFSSYTVLGEGCGCHNCCSIVL